MKRISFAVAVAAMVVAAASSLGAQSASPSPSPSASAAAVSYDGHYTGTNSSKQGCRPGDFDLTVKNGSIFGTVSFASYTRGSQHTYSYAASGSIAGDGTASAQFHSDDADMPANRRDFSMHGSADATSLTLEQSGETCGMVATLLRGK